jgi:hypothetical protein
VHRGDSRHGGSETQTAHGIGQDKRHVDRPPCTDAERLVRTPWAQRRIEMIADALVNRSANYATVAGKL